jgi:hypothetical protein
MLLPFRHRTVEGRSLRASTLATVSALVVVCALSGTDNSDTSAVAYFAPSGPQSFPGDIGIEQTRSGCCSHHDDVCGCNGNTGHQLCCDGKDSPSCGC